MANAASGRTRSASARPIPAAGAVVTREHPTRGTEVLIVHRKRYDDWSLPKGKSDAGESILACAVREVKEETGATIRLGVPLDTIRYQMMRADGSGNGWKQVDYWAGIVLDTIRRAPDDEVDVVSWLPLRAALSRLTYAHDHFLLQQFLEQPPTTPLILVRHGKAMDRGDWSRKDVARPLTASGRRQAKALGAMFGAYGAARLISSTAVRCVRTVQPYASAQDLRVEQFAALTEESAADDPRAVRRLIRSIRETMLAAGQPTVVCIHRPVLPEILSTLELAPTTLAAGEFVVAHLTADSGVHAIERHRSNG